MGGLNAEKWGDDQNKKFFVNNSVEALILFKEGHQGLLKLCVPLERMRGFSLYVCGGGGGGWGDLLKFCLSFGECLEDFNEEKMGRMQKEEVL